MLRADWERAASCIGLRRFKAHFRHPVAASKRQVKVGNQIPAEEPLQLIRGARLQKTQ